jgi:HPt (histidine-containing phosphotransfer) domain-containing protein
MGQAVDFSYLEGFAAGDSTVVREVLELFVDQARLWDAGLAAPDDGWRDLAHTIKGTARGIGAAPLGDLAAEAEHAGPQRAPELRAALAAAVAEVEAYLSDG